MSEEAKDTILLFAVMIFLVKADMNGWMVAAVIALAMFIKEWKDGFR